VDARAPLTSIHDVERAARPEVFKPDAATDIGAPLANADAADTPLDQAVIDGELPRGALDDPRPNAVVLPDLPEGMAWDARRLGSFGDNVMVPSGLTKDQSQALVDWWASLAIEYAATGKVPVDLARALFPTQVQRLGLTPAQVEQIHSWAEANLLAEPEAVP